MPPTIIDILLDYNEGRRPVEEIVQRSRSFQGPEPHWLWSMVMLDSFRHLDHSRFIEFCVRNLTEAKMFELLQALIADDPRVPAITRNGDSLLYAALGALHKTPSVVVSTRALLPLVVPEVARGNSDVGDTPLRRACGVAGDDPALINRLVDLDPGALMMPSTGLGSVLPLQVALFHIPTNPAVERMAVERPKSLLFRNDSDLTPVEHAVRFAPPSAQLASTLRGLVALRPRSVVPAYGMRAATALRFACERFHPHPDLIEEIVRAYPPALALAGEVAPLSPWRRTGMTEAEQETLRRYVMRARSARQRNRWRIQGVVGGAAGPPGAAGAPPLLPIDIAAERTHGDFPAFLREETVPLAVSVVEYMLGGSGLVVAEHGRDAVWFQRHLTDAVTAFLPGLDNLLRL
jgi:hypothetical protein